MAQLSNTKINGDLNVSGQISQNGRSIDSTFIHTIEKEWQYHEDDDEYELNIVTKDLTGNVISRISIPHLIKPGSYDNSNT